MASRPTPKEWLKKFSKQKENNKRRNPGKEGRTAKLWINMMGFPFLQLSKVCLTIEAKIIIMSDVVLYVCRGNT